jgi:hypothetical protein
MPILAAKADTPFGRPRNRKVTEKVSVAPRFVLVPGVEPPVLLMHDQETFWAMNSAAL